MDGGEIAAAAANFATLTLKSAPLLQELEVEVKFAAAAAANFTDFNVHRNALITMIKAYIYIIYLGSRMK